MRRKRVVFGLYVLRLRSRRISTLATGDIVTFAHGDPHMIG